MDKQQVWVVTAWAMGGGLEPSETLRDVFMELDDAIAEIFHCIQVTELPINATVNVDSTTSYVCVTVAVGNDSSNHWGYSAELRTIIQSERLR